MLIGDTTLKTIYLQNYYINYHEIFTKFVEETEKKITFVKIAS